MKSLQLLFAQTTLPTDVIPGAWHWMGLTMTELMVLLGAVGAVTLLVLIWAVYIRKPPKSHSHDYHYPSDNQETMSGGDPEENGEKRYRRKRRRRREHRPRNPTLAETGGLPPARSERPSDPLP
jgi:hypothetical protein